MIDARQGGTVTFEVCDPSGGIGGGTGTVGGSTGGSTTGGTTGGQASSGSGGPILPK